MLVYVVDACRGDTLVQCWVDLLEAVAAGGNATQATFIRAGLTNIPIEVHIIIIKL